MLCVVYRSAGREARAESLRRTVSAEQTVSPLVMPTRDSGAPVIRELGATLVALGKKGPRAFPVLEQKASAI
jgi:hypothetical protein